MGATVDNDVHNTQKHWKCKHDELQQIMDSVAGAVQCLAKYNSPALGKWKSLRGTLELAGFDEFRAAFALVFNQPAAPKTVHESWIEINRRVRALPECALPL
jgi:hypothetical protein